MPLKVAIPAAALIVAISILILLGVLLGPAGPASIPPTPPAPTPTAQAPQQVLEDESLYLAGKCQKFSPDAAPEWYAAHPGIPQCKFKNKK
jgi:hypothetical protein